MSFKTIVTIDNCYTNPPYKNFFIPHLKLKIIQNREFVCRRIYFERALSRKCHLFYLLCYLILYEKQHVLYHLLEYVQRTDSDAVLFGYQQIMYLHYSMFYLTIIYRAKPITHHPSKWVLSGNAYNSMDVVPTHQF